MREKGTEEVLIGVSPIQALEGKPSGKTILEGKKKFEKMEGVAGAFRHYTEAGGPGRGWSQYNIQEGGREAAEPASIRASFNRTQFS